MTDDPPTALTIDSTVGLRAPPGSRNLGVAAGAREGLLVVADGMGGHGTGWLAARLIVHALFERSSTSATQPRFAGAADDVPDLARWAGGAARAAALDSGQCADECSDRVAVPRDLVSHFLDIDRLLASQRYAPVGLSAGCTAAWLEGARVRVAHVGVGRVLRLRAGSGRFESLVVEHYMHLVRDRAPQYAHIDPARIPFAVVVNNLGELAASAVGIDSLEVELGAGDLLLLCSQRLDIPDEELARMARSTVEEGAPLDVLARTIERRAATTAGRARDVAFAIASARTACGEER